MTIWSVLRFAIEAVLVAGGLLLLLPVLVLLLQIGASLLRSRASRSVASVQPSRVVVLIPAHDESTGLVATLRSVLPQLKAADRCLVVADNCSDDTAAVAAAAGADVVERFDATRRGKGYALDFGVRALEADPPEVVVVVDADCIVAPGAIGRVAGVSCAHQRPVQALYLMTAPAPARRGGQIAEFAFRVKNLARPLGYYHLGLPCQLMGTGMAFPWKVLQSIELATGHIVEDLKMGIDLATAGFPPLFCPDASVTSSFPANDAGTKSQRARWEHGHMDMIVHAVPGLLWRGIRSGDIASLALAFDLLVPPLALLVMMTTILAVIAAAAAAFGLSVRPLLLAFFVLACLFITVVTAWLEYGRESLPLATLALAPLYALRKIPLYLKFLIKRQAEWVRSKRDAS